MRTSIDDLNNNCISTSYHSGCERRLGLSRELKAGFVPYSPKHSRKYAFLNHTPKELHYPQQEHDALVPSPTMGHAEYPERIAEMSKEVEEFTGLFTTLLFNTKESLDVIMSLWLYQPSNPTLSIADNVYSVMRTILIGEIDLRIELIIPDIDSFEYTSPERCSSSSCSTSYSTSGINNSQHTLSGHVYVFGGSRLAIPVITIQTDCMTALGALCATSDNAFNKKDVESMHNKLMYSAFRYNDVVNRSLDRKRIIDRMIDFMLMREPGNYDVVKNMLVTVLHKFEGKDFDLIKESYVRLLSGKLRTTLADNRLAVTNYRHNNDLIFLHGS